MAIFAEGIPANRLVQLGINAFQQKSGRVANVKTVDFLTEEADTLVAIINFQDGGFIIMSADDAFAPVIGYDLENTFPVVNASPEAMYYVNGYAQIISSVKKQNIEASAEVAAKWAELENTTRGTRSVVVSPLLTSTWNQSQYYNDLCPEDEESPYGYGGRVPCGCVALAMASVIHYYRYPETGQGSHSYYSNYGYHSVNFAQQTYNYNAMPYVVNKANHEVAKLIYHCGIAVEMGYAPEGSGAQTEDTKNSLKNYYKYSADIEHENRSGGWWGGGGYNDSQWINLLKGDLDLGYPIIYSGYSDEGGHAFVCDGYDSDNNFHFNFGWGGSGNGYYTVATDGNDAVGGFSEWQDIVHNIHPPLNNYPVYCPNVTVNASVGSIEDGSGPNDYQNNTNCTYIVRPENGRFVSFIIKALDLEDGHDFLEFWNGDPDNGGTLVRSMTGNTFNPSDCPYIDGPAAYVRFTSDGAGTAGGWKLHFTSKRHVTCTTTTTYTDPSGSFTDGSGDETYAADANCRWTIKPENATYVTLNFTQFNLSPEDKVTIYNGIDENTSVVLGTFTGSNLPSSVMSNTGVLKVRLESDNYLELDGFAANWNSDGHTEDPDEPNSIENQVETMFEVYPNPANQQLSVIVPARFQGGQLRITDLSGRIVASTAVNTSNELMQLSVADLAVGVYVVSVANSTEVLYKKLVINR